MKGAIYFSKQKLASDFNYSNNDSMQNTEVCLYTHRRQKVG